jgi:hypothetical protein
MNSLYDLLLGHAGSRFNRILNIPLGVPPFGHCWRVCHLEYAFLKVRLYREGPPLAKTILLHLQRD